MLFIGIVVVHDLVISWPAGTGFGLPTLYFLLQFIAMMFQRSATAKRLGVGTGWGGRLLAWLVIVGPAPLLLFHPPFVERVIIPFIDLLIDHAT